MFSVFKRSKTTPNSNIELYNSIDESIRIHLPEDHYLQRQCGQARDIVKKIIALRGRNMKNILTDDLRGIDTTLDNLTISIEGYVESKARIADLLGEQGESAVAINEILKNTPVDPRSSYENQTAQINTRISALNTEENKNHMTQIGISDLFMRYEQGLIDFIRVSNEKDTLESIKVRGTVRDENDSLMKRFDFIFSYLESQAIDVQEKYALAASEILETVKRIMAESQAISSRRETTAS